MRSGSLVDEESLWANASSGKCGSASMRKADRQLSLFAKKADVGTCYTLHEIAEAMGVTRERVRQIEARALKKLYNRLGQVFKNENITPEDAMDMVRRANTGALEHTYVKEDAK